MAGFSLAKGFDRAGLARIADALVVTIAVSLPWSTSVTAILLVLWLIIELPTLDWADVRRAVMTPAGWLPVPLVALGLGSSRFWRRPRCIPQSDDIDTRWATARYSCDRCLASG